MVRAGQDIRRAIVRNPVWPIIRCSGRTLRSVTCHPRRITSKELAFRSAELIGQRIRILLEVRRVR